MASEAVRVAHPVKYQFGAFELFPSQGVLWRDGVRVPVMPKPMAALIVLVERAGQTVSKDELLASVWNGAAVEDNNVTQTISTLRKMLGEKPGENQFIATDPGSGYRFVAGVARIEAAPVPEAVAPLSVPVFRSKRVSKSLVGLAAVVLLCLVAAGAYWSREFPGRGIRRRSVAVLSIRDLSKDSAEGWLQTALPEMLTSELESGGKLHAIPAGDVVEWRSGLGSAPEGEGNSRLLRLARRNFGADAFVLGSYIVTGTCPECRVRVDLGVFDARSGDNLASIIDEAPAQDLLDLTTRLGAKLRANLGVAGERAEPPPWPAPSAMREYAEGVKALERIDPMAARDHLEAAVGADPGNALIHAALADSWTALGYVSRANDESRRAHELSSSLSRLDQLGIEARYRANAQEWDRAIEIYQNIFRLFPDSLEDGLNLARTQYRAMKTAESLATLHTLRQLPAPAGNDPRIDMLEAQNAGAASDYAKTRNYAHHAAEEAKSRGAMYLFARARLLEGGAMQNMADPNFYAVQTEARKVCEQLGDRQCVSRAWRIRGNERFSAGRFEEAQDAYLEGASVARDLGDQAELANLLNGLGVVAAASQHWTQAEQNFLEAISLKKESGYNPSEVQIQLADFYLRMGRRPDAELFAGEAYSEAQKTNAHEELGEVLQLRASLARLDGRLDAAQDMGGKAIAEFRVSNSVAALTLALAAVSSISTARGDLDGAEKQLAEAGTPDFPNLKGTVYPESRGAIELARAELLLAKGQFEKAVEVGKRSAADFSNAHLGEEAAKALITEANALEMLGKHSEALGASQEAEKEAAQGPSPFALASARLAAWRLSSAGDSIEPADLRASVERLRNPELLLEEDIGRAVRAKRSGAPNAKRLFEAVANQAANHGFVTMSLRARSLER